MKKGQSWNIPLKKCMNLKNNRQFDNHFTRVIYALCFVHRMAPGVFAGDILSF
jgi:hypothetical protein